MKHLKKGQLTYHLFIQRIHEQSETLIKLTKELSCRLRRKQNQLIGRMQRINNLRQKRGRKRN